MSNESIKVITVAELNRYVAALLGSKEVLQDLRINAEISGLRRYPSGHIYFNLKDERAQVSCVMFRGHANTLTFEPKDGQSVIASAKAGMYERDGRFQLYVTAMEEEGLGDLHAAFERLKQQLALEGLFEQERKRPIPYLPKTIGVVTSPQGAVIRDIMNVLDRRFPGFRLILAPAAVQGKVAGRELARAVENLNTQGEADVIIIGRGGGSIEDLWAFNEEVVARAVFASRIPVISAVGHETDFTICDYVADMRAPTPSAAAELAVPIRSDLEQYLDEQSENLNRALKQRASVSALRLRQLESADVMRDPKVLLHMRADRVERLEDRMVQAVTSQANRASTAVVRYENRLSSLLDRSISARRERLGALAGRLDALSPLSVLRRGYGFVTDSEGHTVTSIQELSKDACIDIRLADGVASARVEERRVIEESVQKDES